MENRYVSSEKRGGKYELCDEDKEDFKQEKLIQEWLEREGSAGAIEFKHISSKGTARNTLVKASIRLDEKIFDDGAGTYADLVVGSDGRDFDCGRIGDESLPTAQEKIFGYLSALGFNQGEIKCLEKIMWKSSITESSLLLEKSATNLESWTQFELFSE